MLKYVKKYFGRDYMQINEKKLINTINKKWKSKACPMCGNNNWTIDMDMITMIGVGSDLSINIGGKIRPVVAVTCNECGNTIFINALAIECVDVQGDKNGEIKRN